MITLKQINETLDEYEWETPEQRALVCRHLDQFFALLNEARRELTTLEYVQLLIHLHATLKEEEPDDQT